MLENEWKSRVQGFLHSLEERRTKIQMFILRPNFLTFLRLIVTIIMQHLEIYLETVIITFPKATDLNREFLSWLIHVSDKMPALISHQRCDKANRQTKSNLISLFFHYKSRENIICSLGFYQLFTVFLVFRIQYIISLFFMEWENWYC